MGAGVGQSGVMKGGRGPCLSPGGRVGGHRAGAGGHEAPWALAHGRVEAGEVGRGKGCA